MNRSLSLVLGGLLVLIGALWTGQGLGWIGGAMSGVLLWAIIGPLVALLGVALIVRGTRQRKL